MAKEKCKQVLRISSDDGLSDRTIHCSKPVDKELEKKFPHVSHLSPLLTLGANEVRIMWKKQPEI